MYRISDPTTAAGKRQKFTLQAEADTIVVVPNDFGANGWLQKFLIDSIPLYHWPAGFSDDLFGTPTNPLEPGRTYRIRFYSMKEGTLLADMAWFNKDQKGQFVGAQGLPFLIGHPLLQPDKSHFPKPSWFVFSEEEQKLVDGHTSSLHRDGLGEFTVRMFSSTRCATARDFLPIFQLIG